MVDVEVAKEGQMRMRHVLLIGVCVGGVACGGEEGGTTTPTAPTTPAPVPTAITIQGPSTLRTAQSGTFTAQVSLSNGTTQSVTPSWRSDNSSVLTINESGNASAVAHGSATLVATAQGLSASALVRVFQDYQGTWTGAHRIRACDERGAFRGVCQSTFPLGTLLPFEVRLTQNAGSAAGTLWLGQIAIDLSGSVYDSRHFVGGGSGTFTGGSVTFVERVGTLDLLASDNSLSGTLIFTIEAVGFTGDTYLESDLVSITRSSAAAVRTRPVLSFSSEQQFLAGFTQH